MNSAAQEVANAPKKVEVEKQILDSREKLEYYRTKMQDLVLYKSRCDNRLNEITERASSDKREVELLSKKYEEKYKQVAELASKLAVDEAAFRDVQERKVELNDALVKMVQGGSVDGLLQVRADRIQRQLEEMEKAFSERCKHFGLQFKPSASVELPFGWEPEQQEGAVEWDEDWDKFEDEGFGLVKDNGTIVENPASENAKSSSLWDDGVMDEMSPVASSNGHTKDFNHYRAGDQVPESEIAYDFGDESVRSPGSAGRSASGSPFKSSRFGVHDSSPTKKEHTVITVARSLFSVIIMVMKLHGTLTTKILNLFGDLMQMRLAIMEVTLSSGQMTLVETLLEWTLHVALASMERKAHSLMILFRVHPHTRLDTHRSLVRAVTAAPLITLEGLIPSHPKTASSRRNKVASPGSTL